MHRPTSREARCRFITCRRRAHPRWPEHLSRPPATFSIVPTAGTIIVITAVITDKGAAGARDQER